MGKSALQVRGHFKLWAVLPPPTSDWLTVLPLSLWMEYFGSQNIFPPPCHHATEQFTGNNFKRLQEAFGFDLNSWVGIGLFFCSVFCFFVFTVPPPPLFSVFLYCCLIRLLCVVVVVFHTVSSMQPPNRQEIYVLSWFRVEVEATAIVYLFLYCHFCFSIDTVANATHLSMLVTQACPSLH